MTFTYRQTLPFINLVLYRQVDTYHVIFFQQRRETASWYLSALFITVGVYVVFIIASLFAAISANTCLFPYVNFGLAGIYITSKCFFDLLVHLPVPTSFKYF